MVVGMITLGVLGVSAITSTGFIWVNREKRLAEEEETKQQEERTKQANTEAQRQKELSEVSRENLVALTPNVSDDVVLFLQDNALPLAIIIVASIFAIIFLTKK